jgi:hypothetical protein
MAAILIPNQPPQAGAAEEPEITGRRAQPQTSSRTS